ncbi:UNVERIFIED_CONTAM: hypothetical protein Sradi_2519900 [Sesamum radiatum]|uniref:Aminotransferase-like plant mobile domain-containing protein n=1 Tax=Sesamum radiatum TaxID=300843 RepID=A0AAW2SMM2_SESRA
MQKGRGGVSWDVGTKKVHVEEKESGGVVRVQRNKRYWRKLMVELDGAEQRIWRKLIPELEEADSCIAVLKSRRVRNEALRQIVGEILEVLPSSSVLIPSPVICLDHSFEFLGDFWATTWFTSKINLSLPEWTEDVLSRCGDRLHHLKIYDVVYASLFTYDHNSDIVKAFCEAWCPLTNTLLTSAREMSISLWDLCELAGLPMTGCLYDEIVPSVLELTGIDEKRERFIPRSSKYLFYAYHLLQSADDNRCSHVSVDKWVKFWSTKTIKYHPPPPHKEKKTVRPKSTHNPLGHIAIHERWSTAEEALFAKLCIERSLKEEVYLAAYLACWLCVLVLPGKDVNSIRPSTFKMVSLIENSRRVNLAIPVLASIYEGLNTIATSPKPAGTLRYDTRVTSLEEGLRYWRLCVLSKSPSKAWFPCLPPNAKKLCSEAYKAWWAKVHGTFLDDNIACLIRPMSIKITFKRKKDEDKQVDGSEDDPPHALIPPIVIECDSQAAIAEASKGKCSSHNVADSDSSNKDRHWKRQRKEVTPLKATETNENALRSSLANFIVEFEDEVQSIDVGEESETSHLSTMTPPLGMELRKKRSPPPATVSVLKGESCLFNY